MKKIILSLFLLGTLLSANAQVPGYVPSSGLVGWWPFSGNANDESGSGNNGTVNGATLTSDLFGNANKAYYFDGIDDYVNILSNNQLLLTGNEFAISAWVTHSGFNNFDENILVKSDGIQNQPKWLFWYKASINSPSGLGFASNQKMMGGSQNNIFLNDWYHYLVIKTIDSLMFYIDGIKINSVAVKFNNPNTTANLRIGGQEINGGDQWWLGKLDDIGIWNRALTPKEISNLYKGCQLTVKSQPSSKTININNNAQFVVGSSDSNATYQWQTDLGVGFQKLNNVGQYWGSTNDTLTILNTTMSNNNQPFRCIVGKGDCSDTSKVAVLTIKNNVGVNKFYENKLFSVYPNPAKNVINLNADLALIRATYIIYDNTGRSVLSGNINSVSTIIELGNLSGGNYVISIGDNMKQTFNVIK